MRVVIDRFEGRYAVCETEDRKMINIEKRKLPHGTKEGDILDVTSETIEMNREETEKRKKEIDGLFENLWE